MSLFRPTPSAIPALAELRRRRWRWFFIIFFSLIILVLALRPVYRWGKAWRARSLAAKGELATSSSQWEQAAEHIRAAMQLAPGEPATLRAAARLYTQVGAPQAFAAWKSVLALPTVTSAERREAVRFGIRVQRFDLADEQLALLLKSEPAHPENLDLAAEVAFRKNDRASATKHTERLLALDPAHAGARLRHGQLLLSSAEPQERTNGIEALQTLGRSDAPTSLAALETLARHDDVTPSVTRAVSAALTAHPAARTEHRLLAVSLQIRLAPEQKVPLVERAISEIRSDDPAVLMTLARWTFQHGESARVLDLIPLPLSLKRQDLFLVRADALAVQKDWTEIRRILTEERTPVIPFHREVFLARAAIELNEAALAETHWTKALDEAAQEPALLAYLAGYAQTARALPIAEKAWRRLARHPSWTLRAHVALLPILEAQGDTRGMRDVMRKLAALKPKDPVPRHDAAYLDLLLGDNIPSALKTAEELLRQYPDRLAYLSTVALGYLRTGNPSAALQQYDRPGIPWEKATPNALAIRAAVLAANNDLAGARTATASIPLNALRPEERELLTPVQRTLPKLRAQPTAIP